MKIEVLTAVFLKIQELLHVKLCRLVPDVSDERSAFETSGTTQPSTQRYSPEYLNVQGILLLEFSTLKGLYKYYFFIAELRAAKGCIIARYEAVMSSALRQAGRL